jgi:porin
MPLPPPWFVFLLGGSAGSSPEVPAPAYAALILAQEFVEQQVQERLAQQEQRRQDPPTGQLGDRDRSTLRFLLLDWGGARSRLEEAGLQIGLLATVDGSWAAAGGAAPQGTALRSLLELNVSFETGPLLGLEGGTVYTDLQLISGDDGSSDFGVLQAVSNIDADHRFQLSRLWYEQEVPSWGTAVRLGKMDANTQFAYVDAGAGFLHSSMGFSPTILGMPTYPDPAFGLVVKQRITSSLRAGVGVYDGAAQEGVPTGSRGPSTLFGEPSDLFGIAELDLTWERGRAAVGGWAHTGRFERFDGGEEHGTHGLYGLVEQRLAGACGEDADPCGLDAFLQLGVADPDVSLFDLHVGAGLAWTCPFSTGLEDELGIGFSSVRLTDDPDAEVDGDFETAFELYYGFEPVSWVRVKPDVQYVVNPGGDGSLDDALILTLRLVASL